MQIKEIPVKKRVGLCQRQNKQEALAVAVTSQSCCIAIAVIWSSGAALDIASECNNAQGCLKFICSSQYKQQSLWVLVLTLCLPLCSSSSHLVHPADLQNTPPSNSNSDHPCSDSTYLYSLLLHVYHHPHLDLSLRNPVPLR